jgi:anti-anti-sigma factor
MAIREHFTPTQSPAAPLPASAPRVRGRRSWRQLPPSAASETSASPETVEAAGMLVEAVDRAGTFRLVGELDCSTISYVRDALSTPMLRSGRLTLDLSQLTFMGSEGIHLFTDLARQRDGIGVVVLSRPGGMARRVLGLGQLDELPNLRIDPATDSARTNLNGRFPDIRTRRGAPT